VQVVFLSDGAELMTTALYFLVLLGALGAFDTFSYHE
jgi:hypothetical protein